MRTVLIQKYEDNRNTSQDSNKVGLNPHDKVRLDHNGQQGKEVQAVTHS